ncbi:MAG: hypothetical protein P8Y02_11290, partial [Deinococcales bacterium]
LVALTVGGCGTTSSTPGLVQLFPDPTDPASSPFPAIDDAYLEVPFTSGFAFPFYGTTYRSVYLNTNGGLTFAAGDDRYDVGVGASAVRIVTLPTIAVFWGDMHAGRYSGVTRTDQMSYQQFPDRFVVHYVQLQDFDEATWNNTAAVTLYADGDIEIAYGAVLSRDVLVGVFDGTHVADSQEVVQATFADYPSYGSGIVLFDYWGGGAVPSGQLDGRTIAFRAP